MGDRRVRRVQIALSIASQALRRLPVTLENLEAALPGFPARTVGDGNPPSGGGGPAGGSTMPERHTDLLTFDPAIRDLRRIDDAAGNLERAAIELDRVSLDWGWDHSVSSDRVDHRLTAVPDPATDCASCIRLHASIGRFRGDLCRWCYGFDAVEKMLPPLTLLQVHLDGGRVTPTMVRACRPQIRRARKTWPTRRDRERN